MEPNTADGTSDSSTETQGENTSVETPSTESKATAKPLAQKLHERFLEKKKQTADSKDPAAVDGDKKAGDVATTDVKAKDAKSEAKGEETVPLAAFKARLGKETEKRKAIQEKLDEATTKLSRSTESLRIAIAELNREREARVNGTPFDAKDDQIRQFEIEKQAREAIAKIDGETTKAKTERASAERQEVYSDLMRSEFNDALASAPMVGRQELIDALRLPANEQRTFADVAKELHAVNLNKAKTFLSKERPESPSTIKAKAGGSHRVEPTRDLAGMRKRMAEIRAAEPASAS